MQAGRFIAQGVADRETQKVIFDGFNKEGQPMNPRIVNQSAEEIETKKKRDIIKPIPFEKQPAKITNEQWQSVLDRLDKLS